MSLAADSETSTAHARSDLDDRTRWQRRWLEIALIFVVFFVAGGAPVPHVNETHYLAKAKQYWQPDWCAGDLFLESGKAHLTFYWTVGLLTKWFALPTVAWIGRVFAWLALAITWQRLSRTVVGLPFGSVLTAMLMVTLIDWTNFAGEWVVGGVEGKCFAYALVFLGLAALAEERWRWVWPCFGLAAAFHALVGGWSTIAVGLVWLSLPRVERPALLPMLPSVLLGGLLALPGILPALQLTQNVSPEVIEEANQIYVFDRLPHHLAPLAMNSSELSSKSLRFSWLLLGFVLLRFFCCRQPGNPYSLQAYSLRAYSLQEGGTCVPSFRPLDLLMRFALAALAISVAGLAWELATWNQPATAARVLKYYVFRLADVALPLATSLGVVWLAQALSNRQSKWGIALILLAVSLPTWHLLNVSQVRYKNPCPPAVRKMKNPAAWLDACQWIRENTPDKSLFLVPRRAQSFKWYAHRSDLVTWKDVPQNAADLLVWRDRLFDVHHYVDAAGESTSYGSLASQGTERIRKLAEKYQLDYILTVEYPPLLLPVVFTNDRYTIYSFDENHTSTP